MATVVCPSFRSARLVDDRKRSARDSAILCRWTSRRLLRWLVAASWQAIRAQPRGIDLVHPGTEPYVTVARDRSRARRSGVVVARSALPAGDTTEVEGVPVTTVVRTLTDLSRTLPLEDAVAAADSALRKGLVRVDELTERLLKMPGGKRNDRCRSVARMLDPAAGSVIESVIRVMFLLGGLIAPFTQWPIHDEAGAFVARVDFAWPAARLVVEIDGFAYHADRESYRRDRRRNNELERLGWRVLRFTWEDVMLRPEHVVATVRSLLEVAA